MSDSNKIKCPKCGESFEPSEAYKHELEESLLKETQAKHQEDIKRLEKEKLDLAESTRLETEKKAKKELETAVEAAKEEAEAKNKQNSKLKEELEEQSQLLADLKEEKSKLRRDHEQELEDVRRQTAEISRKEAEEKIRKELKSQITASNEESKAREDQNKELQDQVKELLKQMRELKDDRDKLGIEYEKKLLEGQDKIKQDAKKEAQDELNLRIAEKDKKLQDAEKQILELQRKIQQGPQNLQGEVQELELQEILSVEFPFDEIKEVPKGVSGADVLQTVKSQTGEVCGTIIWESKRTKTWGSDWIQKLKDDQRMIKADLAILVSTVLPQNVSSIGIIDGVTICELRMAVSIAQLLRQQLMKVHSAQVANDGKATKAEIVYNYLISNEFRQRIEVWVEYFKDRQEKINRERIYFNKKWQEEEKSIQKVITNTAGIYGDLQGLIGNALPKVSYLELPDSTEETENN
ncbi:hypothetical protein A2630_00530 [Candidatus Woesebacteria bacterium RIFCSPHIGHO2_01_FULL_44_10]|uniref:DUF2130 domain-containing protein n=1 Tax=Candidatus Woesebacteria bacterium RIFCSPLOWO2_01_FULL_44_14 TaxID=1802525 RepID=A0A1F8C1Q0_9BACT|nr:MAG: hypothetical protein A2630_00530 [Candidatus Woesebacteria bacterium RIFCSPHIGHO2_01_FULL_44_10]OGM54388.1 MAG: hypothetical protein A3F62_01395 [Candidatus Woesebacteria bacterium RIFCSPHIGHO2_12_FULL_44_11]OGM70291.1 MAG: hypothetical protein A2975_04445 [Candidatus Woesebacteria bacterium RIFCSPLOWO2_01_FULL_44_14]